MAIQPSTKFNFARHLLEVNALRPQSVAFVDDQALIRYGELGVRIKRFGSGLLSLGLTPGDRVLLVLPNQIDDAPTTVALLDVYER